MLVETIEGNVSELLNKTIFQDKSSTQKASSAAVNAIELIQRGGKIILC